MIEKKTTITLSVTGLGLLFIWALVDLRPAPEQIERPKPSPLSVDIMEARPGQHRVEVFSQGTIAPKREAQLVAQVSGQIKSVSDKILVLKTGKGIEYDNAKNVFKNPKSDYTKKLIN